MKSAGRSAKHRKPDLKSLETDGPAIVGREAGRKAMDSIDVLEV
jgi:hypothetical protein